MTYQRIEPYPENSKFDFPELHALSSVWLEKKSQLENNGAFIEFVKKLNESGQLKLALLSDSIVGIGALLRY